MSLFDNCLEAWSPDTQVGVFGSSKAQIRSAAKRYRSMELLALLNEAPPGTTKEVLYLFVAVAHNENFLQRQVDRGSLF